MLKFAGDYCLLVRLILLSCEINLTLERVVFNEIFSEAWDQKLWVTDNLVLFLYHSSIYIYIHIHIYILNVPIYLSIYLSIIDNTFIYPNVIYFLFMEFYLLKMPSNALCYWKWLFLKFSWSWKEMKYFCYLWWKKVIYYVQHLKWFSFCRKAAFCWTLWTSERKRYLKILGLFVVLWGET